ncbi:1188_t:CDS:2 [Acaulospora morrowiae]|uniref:Tubulin-specific chaperone A n=1 Tax=Acaulospora morrowiae TaxID=94023 RepID=A0A9N9CRB3_9GLOM|nr:1188_t:CDS:2 [Acaulospora morrowiae]
MSLRELKIKNGVVIRLFNEEKSYHKEVENQKKRIVNITAQGADAYDIAKQNEVLEESQQMIHEVRKSLNKAYKELQDLVSKQDPSWSGTEELKQAEDILKKVGPELIAD